MKNVLLVDLSNIYYIAWHGGVNKDARWPFTDTMGRVRAEARKYDACAVMTDGRNSFRRGLDPRWKADREEKYAGATAMLAEVERALDSEGLHVFKADTFEADDLIATAVDQLRRCSWPDDPEGASITINSCDRDLLGLLDAGAGQDNKVQMLWTNGAPRLVQAEDVRSNPKIGVDPPKVRDFLVLCDDHNGVKYFPGIGPVHAARLLNEYGNLNGVLCHADQIEPPKVRESIRTAMSSFVGDDPLVDVAVQIMTLRTDAPIDITRIFRKKEPRPREDPWDENASADENRSEHGDSPAASSSHVGVNNGQNASTVGMGLGGGVGPVAMGARPPALVQPVERNQGPSQGQGRAQAAASASNLSATEHFSPHQTQQVGHGSNALPERVGSRKVDLAAGTECQTTSQTLDVQPMGGDKNAGSRENSLSPQSVIVAPRWELALEPTTTREAYRLAQVASAANFWPRHNGVEGCMMIIMAGRSRGLAAFDALNGMHIIEGKPVFGAYLLIGMVQGDKRRCLYFELVESDEKHAKWITKRKGGKVEQSRTYTIEQADKAGLLRPTLKGAPSNWTKHPEDFLIKASGAKLTRAVYADITSGAVAAEEMGYE